MDVAVVGGGPAGAWTAERLARVGARVTVFDSSHPREKPCGGGVTGRALALVSGAVDLESIPRTVIRAARFLDGHAPPVLVPLDGLDARDPRENEALVVASRSAFDGALLAAAVRAGAVLERARVRDVTVDASGVRLDTDAGSRRASFVVGADGANSLVRRRLARAFRRDQLSIAAGVFARGATSDEIVIEFASNPAGYLWSFPRPDHLAIGICAGATDRATSGDLRARAVSWTRRAGLADGARLDAYAWPIPTLSARDVDDLDVGGPRWAVVGDAAGLVDPITREGIYFALASGASIAGALAAGRPGGYRERIQAEILTELARAARFKAAFFRPAFTGLLVAALRQSPAIRRVMADLISGRQSYRSLKWRLLGTWEWGVAARAVVQSLSAP